MLIVGERINASRERVAQAIERRDSSFIQQEALKQVEAGADYLEVNAGVFAQQEAECLQWLVKTVQQVTDIPLCLDSANPEVLATVVKQAKGKTLVNSVTAEKEKYDALLSWLKDYNCGVVALCIDKSGIPATAEKRADLAERIISYLTAAGIASYNIFVDPVVQSISMDSKTGVIMLEALSRIRQRCPGVQTICGISNISFGLPVRNQLNQVFLVLARERGLDAAIIDPCDRKLLAALITAETLLGNDDFCLNYIKAYRGGRLIT